MSGIVYNEKADNRYNNVDQSKTFNIKIYSTTKS